MNTTKIVLITGATAGIGRTTALFLARQGHHVIATGRKTAALDALAREAGTGRLDTLVLDVTTPASIADAVTAVDALTSGAGIDVLVNNAGFGVLGPTSEISDSELRRQYETNVFGLMNVTRAFLPAMRARRSGRIINVSSVGGRITLPYFGAYNSTKYALESLSDALRYELRPFGIDVSLIEPGVIRTNFEATAASNLATLAETTCAAALDKYDEMSKLADRFASNPSSSQRRSRAPSTHVARPRVTWRHGARTSSSPSARSRRLVCGTGRCARSAFCPRSTSLNRPPLLRPRPPRTDSTATAPRGMFPACVG
ncbi:MAG TPA: SDR family oxidoreductase [Kofleriaceae bacterium]|nr:SDR family oxidoreductase [Kofleriaceae bacterium]